MIGLFTPEDRHDIALKGLALASKFPFCLRQLEDWFGTLPDHSTIPSAGPAGNTLPHPIGLPAGFDKNCIALPAFQALGFSYLIGGTVIPKPQHGNNKPRVWRFPNDQTIINAMGFPSQGAEQVARNLEKIRHKVSVPLGISAGKQKETELPYAGRDYVQVMEVLEPYVDFWEHNISSPNTPGLRELLGKEYVRRFLHEGQGKTNKRIFIKLPPDLTEKELEIIIEACQEAGVRNLTIGNTTTSRDGLSVSTDVPGGMSGPMLLEKSLRLVSLARKLASDFLINGVGGIFTGNDVLQMKKAGADTVQIYTGFVYRGPRAVRTILSEMLACERQLQQTA